MRAIAVDKLRAGMSGDAYLAHFAEEQTVAVEIDNVCHFAISVGEGAIKRKSTGCKHCLALTEVPVAALDAVHAAESFGHVTLISRQWA